MSCRSLHSRRFLPRSRFCLWPLPLVGTATLACGALSAPLRFLSVDKSSYYWTVALSRVQWGGKTEWTQSGLNAILFDTGTTGVYLPGSLVNKDSSCSLLIFASDEISIAAGLNAQWILGGAFLRQFYSVYDYAHGRVGLAPRR
ncbi:unnamed protein product, partial [Mesorhabditis belari]|uniref:Peptidase A1 domain-containing protein n=1 Tax=Mesorhabditis belari TaxID=2138241 RepID=A0AAF3F6J9_9BILA